MTPVAYLLRWLNEFGTIFCVDTFVQIRESEIFCNTNLIQKNLFIEYIRPEMIVEGFPFIFTPCVHYIKNFLSKTVQNFYIYIVRRQFIDL